MYDVAKEKEKILSIVKDVAKIEVKYTKEQNFFRAISFALDEVNEAEKSYLNFMDSISHLVIFEEMVQGQLHTDMQKLFQNLRYLIEKNYTQGDKQKMPEDVLNQVKATQDRRIELLKKVARKYFHHNQD
jgi:hypothetical protein